MQDIRCKTPEEIHSDFISVEEKKASNSVLSLFLLGIMAGLMIALGAEASNCAMHSISNVGLSRLVAGAVFPVGLISLTLLGGELFTGNTLMLTGLTAGRFRLSAMLKNWIVVYLGNMTGSVLIAFIVSETGQWNYSDGGLGATTIKIALGKVELSPLAALCSGIMCNIFVCIAVLMASGAKWMISKIVAIFIPICAFVVSGFEHSVANMYYIPAGIIASHNPAYASKAEELYGISGSRLKDLDILHFLYNNLLFVTLGNIIGGGVIIGLMYYAAFLRKKKNS